jgi:DNA polymerase-3 subunit gamma/tau
VTGAPAGPAYLPGHRDTAPSRPQFPASGDAAGAAGPAAVADDDARGATPSFGGPEAFGGGDLPPLPPPPPPDDEDFDPDDEDLTAAGVTELTGMALVQRELGGQVIAEYED